MKFTFKTHKPTGKYRSFQKEEHDIKLDKKVVGSIFETDDRKFVLRFMIEKKNINEDGNRNCSWRWIQLTHRAETLQDAKTFLNEHIEQILTKYNLHKLED